MSDLNIESNRPIAGIQEKAQQCLTLGSVGKLFLIGVLATSTIGTLISYLSEVKNNERAENSKKSDLNTLNNNKLPKNPIVEAKKHKFTNEDLISVDKEAASTYEQSIINKHVLQKVPEGLERAFVYHSHRYNGDEQVLAIAPCIVNGKKKLAIANLFVGFADAKDEKSAKENAKNLLLKFLKDPNAIANTYDEEQFKKNLAETPEKLKKYLLKLAENGSASSIFIASSGKSEETYQNFQKVGKWWSYIVKGFNKAISTHPLNDKIETDPLKLFVSSILESSGINKAVSQTNAKGLFQFMPDTAREVGIPMNGAFDGRFDPEHAAEGYVILKYKLISKSIKLNIKDTEGIPQDKRKDLTETSGLVDTSYNQGPGNTNKFLNKADEKSMFKLYYSLLAGNRGDFSRPSIDGANYFLRYLSITNTTLELIEEKGGIFKAKVYVNPVVEIFTCNKPGITIYDFVPNFKELSETKKNEIKDLNPGVLDAGWKGEKLPEGAYFRLPK